MHVVYQQQGLSRNLGCPGAKGRLDVFLPRRRVQTHLRERMPDTHKTFQTDRDLQPFAQRPGEQGRLIVGSPPEPPAMHGHGHDSVHTPRQIPRSAFQPRQQRREQKRLVPVFEATDQAAAGLIVHQRRPGATEGRWFRETGRAQLTRRHRHVKRHTTTGTTGLCDKRQALPARRAQRALFHHHRAAHATGGRQQEVGQCGKSRNGKTGAHGLLSRTAPIYAIQEVMSVPVVFDLPLLARRRNRAAADFAQHAFLYEEAGVRLLERLPDIRRTFPLAALLGARTGMLVPRLRALNGIETVVRLEMAERMAAQNREGAGLSVVARTENLPLKPGTCDLIVSVMDLHWTNDLPGALVQIRQALKPDGLFLAVLAGGRTLIELRQSLMAAELAVTGGAAPRVSPLLDLHDAAVLLQRTGFALPVADREVMTLDYPSPAALFRDLRGLGATSTLAARARSPLRRAVWTDMLAHYSRHFPGTAPGSVQATVELIFLTGWAPAPDQPRPLARGSARESLATVLQNPLNPGGR